MRYTRDTSIIGTLHQLKLKEVNEMLLILILFDCSGKLRCIVVAFLIAMDCVKTADRE